MRKKSWLIHVCWGTGVVAIIAAAAVVIAVIFGRVAEYETQLIERDKIIEELSAKWEALGSATSGLVLIKDVRGGQEIRADNWQKYFQEVNYPENLNLNVATASDFDTTKYIRASMSVGTVLTQDDILDTRMEDSLRYYYIRLDEFPIELLPGKYIDIRIRFPFGQDFIALNHKKVEEIYDGALKIVVSEQDIYTYNSMLTDKVLYQAQLYATEYVDTGAQQAADKFYPLNYNQQELLLKNPNALEIVQEEMRLSRELLEAEMPDTQPADLEQLQAKYEALQQQYLIV